MYVETLVLRDTLEDQMFRRRKAMTTQEHQRASKSPLDDMTMNDIIKHIRFHYVSHEEMLDESFHMAQLKFPQQVFAREFIGDAERLHQATGGAPDLPRDFATVSGESQKRKIASADVISKPPAKSQRIRFDASPRPRNYDVSDPTENHSPIPATFHSHPAIDGKAQSPSLDFADCPGATDRSGTSKHRTTGRLSSEAAPSTTTASLKAQTKSPLNTPKSPREVLLEAERMASKWKSLLGDYDAKQTSNMKGEKSNYPMTSKDVSSSTNNNGIHPINGLPPAK